MVCLKKLNTAFAVLAIFGLVCLTSCAGVAKMVSVSAKLGREVDQLTRMSKAEVEKLVDSTINMNRIKSDPEGILGQYVSFSGKADLEGSKDFPIEDRSKGSHDTSGTVFILDNELFVITIDPLPWLKNGDYVTVLGLVSESRFLKEISELYPKEKIPGLVTVIAKDVQKVESKAEGESEKESVNKDDQTSKQ